MGHQSPMALTVGTARTEGDMSALNSALMNIRVHQESRNKRCDQGWGNPIQTLNKIPRMHTSGEEEETGVFGMQISVSLRVEYLLRYVRSVLRKPCQGLGRTCLSSHISWGNRTTHQPARGEEDREAQAGSSAAPHCQGAGAPVPFPSPDVLPSKRASEEKAVTVSCCSDMDRGY